MEEARDIHCKAGNGVLVAKSSVAYFSIVFTYLFQHNESSPSKSSLIACFIHRKRHLRCFCHIN